MSDNTTTPKSLDAPDEAIAAKIADEVLPDHVRLIDGTRHRRDDKARWTPESVFKAQDVLQDDMVREMLASAREMRERLSAFREEALGRAEDFRELLAQEYDAPKGGVKGNVTFSTIDQTMRFSVRVNDTIVFGPELQQAKTILDDLLSEWSEGSRPEIRTIVMRAFDVGKEGQINKGELFMLLRLDIDEPRWKEAMRAIRDSIRRDGTKVYVRFEERDSPDGAWRSVSLDIAKA